MPRVSLRTAKFVLLIGLLSLLASIASAQTIAAPKLDESLRQSIAQGCVGTRAVIIRTKPGYREGLRASLTAHGDEVNGEFPAIDAVAATVHCDDLGALSSFNSTNSISSNAQVAGQVSVEDAATARVNADINAVAPAENAIHAAQNAQANAQHSVDLTQAVLNGLLMGKKPAVLVSAAQNAVAQAQAKLETATANLARANAALAAAQAQLSLSQQHLQAVTDHIAQANAANALQARFFATLGLGSAASSNNSNQVHSSSVMLGTPGNYGSYPDSGNQQRGHTDGSDSVGVAVIDSGIEAGPDFDDRITAFYDFTQGDIRVTAPSDEYGHGTHIAGLIGSSYVGVNPNARLIGLKVLNARGRGTTGNVLRAIEFAIANRKQLDIQILNISLGHPIYEPAATDPLVQAVEHAVREGLVVVVSAGNVGINRRTGLPGYAGIMSPANSPSAISVGAVKTFDTTSRDDDRVAPYSSRGPSWYDGFAKPDLVAPGDNLLSIAAANSTLRIAQEKRGNTGDYMRLSGTSMAAGVMSGVAGLVLQTNPGLTPNALKAVLEYSAISVHDDAGQPFNALTQGAGEVNAAGAMTLVDAIDPLAPVGSRWLMSEVMPSTTIGTQTYAWSQEIIWGNHIARGSDILAEQRPAWALAIIWGDALDDHDNIVWGNSLDAGDNIVWGNAFDAGDNIVWGNNIVWADSLDDDNIVWGNNIVWGDGLIGMVDGDNIVWGNTLADDNIVWGNLDDDNIVWGNLFDDNIVWGNSLDDDLDNIVWGNSLALGQVTRWSGGIVIAKADNARARRSIAKAEVK